jgi:hypothetical protein
VGPKFPRCGPREMHGPDELNHLGTKMFLRHVGFGSFSVFFFFFFEFRRSLLIYIYKKKKKKDQNSVMFRVINIL